MKFRCWSSVTDFGAVGRSMLHSALKLRLWPLHQLLLGAFGANDVRAIGDEAASH